MLNIYSVLKIFCIIRKLKLNGGYRKKEKVYSIKEKVVQNGNFVKKYFKIIKIDEVSFILNNY